MLFCCYHFVFTQKILSYLASILHCGMLCTHLSRVTLRIIKMCHMYLVYKTFQGRKLSNFSVVFWKINNLINTFWHYLTFRPSEPLQRAFFQKSWDLFLIHYRGRWRNPKWRCYYDVYYQITSWSGRFLFPHKPIWHWENSTRASSQSCSRSQFYIQLYTRSFTLRVKI